MAISWSETKEGIVVVPAGRADAILTPPRRVPRRTPEEIAPCRDCLRGRWRWSRGAAPGSAGRRRWRSPAKGRRSPFPARRKAEGEETVGEIERSGGDALFVRVDVSSEDDVRGMVESVARVYGRLDCAFNNAGALGGSGPLAEAPKAAWDTVIGTNLTGVWPCMKYEIPDHAGRTRWRDRQQRLGCRAPRVSLQPDLRRQQVRRRGADTERRRAVRKPGYPHQRCVPRLDPDPHDGAVPGQSGDGRRCARDAPDRPHR